MITKDDIDRINFLSRKSRQQALSEEEKSEQQALRKKYIEYIKAQVKVQLDNIEYVDDKCDCCSDDKNQHKNHHHHKN